MSTFQADLIEILPRLRRLARALAGDVAGADELVRLTIERALAQRAQWGPGTRLDIWTFRILKSVWLETKRAAAPPPAARNHPMEAGGLLDARRVEAEIAALPDDQRLAVALVLVERLSYREAMEVLEAPMGTLTARLVRGRNAILERLGLEEGR